MLSIDGHEEGVQDRREKVTGGAWTDESVGVFLGVRTGLVRKSDRWRPDKTERTTLTSSSSESSLSLEWASICP